MPENEIPFHSLTVEESFQQLETRPRGLPQAEAERRLETYGRNEVETERRNVWLDILLTQLRNPLLIVLLVAAAISLAIGETLDAAVIGAVIVLNTIIGFIQEYRAESALEALQSRAAPEAEVLRCSDAGDTCQEMTVKASDIVPGDVVLLDAGGKVPADARLFEARNLEVDESMLTGESLPVRKTDEPLEEDLPTAERTNLVFSGTNVTHGRGRAVVFATGSRTEMGQIATLIQETEKVESPLQQQTGRLSRWLGALALGLSALTLTLGLLRGFEFQEIFLFALASAVSSIPEGLPAVMTITLAVGVNRMARRNAIIRRLPAVDTLGAATVICTDKTGTLTQNEMTVQQILAGDRIVHVTGAGYAPQGEFRQDGRVVDPLQNDCLRLALQIAALANDARLTRHDTQDEGGEPRWEIRGDPTEGGLIVAAAKADLHKERLERELPRVDEIPFSAQNKYMATFHETPEGQIAAYVKGAPETVLERCTQIRVHGQTQSLDEQRRRQILDVNAHMAASALRVLAVACQIVPPGELEAFKQAIQTGQVELIFAGLLGMIDPARPEVPEAVVRSRQAGIRVIMATGDHQITGEAIAREVGILDGGGRVFNGSDVEHMSDEQLDAVIEEARVFARVSPGHKHRIVESLQRQGHVVAMTGDGVNDAPALKASEIGVAMGITGTDVTKETAEMVLTDDNFASIVNAVEEGRVVFQNVRKVVKFLIATNVGEDLTILSSLLLLPAGQLIITPVQILWVNLVTDGLLDVAIAMEPKEGDVMHESPRQPNAPIINREILLSVLYVGVFMAVGTLGMFQWAGGSANPLRAQTVAFATIAMFQVFNALNVRSRTKSLFQIGPFSNRYLLAALAASVALQVLSTTVPFLQATLGTVALAPGDWGRIVLVASSIFFGDELRKLVQRRLRARK